MQDNSSSNRRTGPPNIWLPPGFRFHPTDDELITFYLMKKVVNNKFCAHAIADVDLNKYEPWDLPDKANMGEKEWYFFSLRDRKYPTGMRTNRATEAGYWKATGKDRDVRGAGLSGSNHNSLVGMKKTLVFYKGRAPRGEKTNWVMHEYRLEGKTAYLYGSRAAKEEWVVCRIFQKRALAAKLKLGQHHALGEDGHDSDVPSSPMMDQIKQEYKNSPSELDGDFACNDHLSCSTTNFDNGNKDDHHHSCNNSSSWITNSSLFKNGLYTSGDFAKLFDPDFLPGLRGSGCGNQSPTPPPLVFSKGAPFADNVSCKTGHNNGSKHCKSEPYNSSPSAADSLISYNKIVEASFAGLLGGSETNNLSFDQQQLQQSQQQISADQGFLNELLFSRFLADPPPSGSADLDQLYAY